MWAGPVLGKNTLLGRGVRGSRARRAGGCPVIFGVLLAVACGGSDKADSHSNGGRTSGGNGGGASAGNGGVGGTGPGSALVGRYWGHLPDNGGPVVLEVPSAGSDSGVPARIWRHGESTDTTLAGSGPNWIFSGERLADCSSLSFEPSLEQVRLTCGQKGDVTLVLRRSRATRILEGAAKASALGFDNGEVRFAFANARRFWLWDAAAGRLHDLGEGAALSPGPAGPRFVSVVFAPDGRRLAYLRAGTAASCKATSLMSFDLASEKSEELAEDAPCSPGFAQFSPDGKHLLYFAHDAGDGSGVDLMHWSVADGTSTLIASQLKTANQAPYLLFGASGQRLVFSTSTLLFGPQPLSSYDFTTHQVSVLSAAARDIAASNDGAFVAFNESNGQVNLWDDGANALRVMYAKPASAPDAFYRSGMSVSPNGRTFAFVTSDGDPMLYDTTAAAPLARLGTTGLFCYPERPGQSDSPMRAAYFTPDGTGILYFPTRMGRQSDCSGGTPATPFRFRGIAAGRELDGVRLGEFYRFGPHGEVVSLSAAQVSLWSPERGAASILDLSAFAEPWRGFNTTFTGDAPDLVVELLDNAPHRELWAWSAKSSSTQITAALAMSGFGYSIEPVSGDVLFLDDSAKLRVWSPVAEPLELLEHVDAEVASESKRTIAVHATRGDERGIFAFRFGARQATLIEEGTILAVSDSHVYYQAPDGVCELAY